ncbi:MAG: HAD hydrolase-like protein [Chloroflexota bacterium]
MARRLILFDIDGTLIAANRAGRQVLSRALHEVFGTHGALDSTSFAGKTDLGIIASALATSDLAEADIAAELPRLYAAMARQGEQIFRRDSLIPCPGIVPLLAELRTKPDIILGLQTGNIQATALLKLRAAGLDPTWFPVGAFGSDSVTREGLFPVAWRRANNLTRESFSGHNTIAVGDTPGDILSAQANGVTALAVASGFSHVTELAECRPDHLLPDLSDIRAVLTILTMNHERKTPHS